MSVSIYFVLCSPELIWDCYADGLYLGPHLLSSRIWDELHSIHDMDKGKKIFIYWGVKEGKIYKPWVSKTLAFLIGQIQKQPCYESTWGLGPASLNLGTHCWQLLERAQHLETSGAWDVVVPLSCGKLKLGYSLRHPCSWHNWNVTILLSLRNGQCTLVGRVRVLGFNNNKAIYFVSITCQALYICT